MGLSLSNNVSSLTAQQNLQRTSGQLSSSLERLSSGLKVNRGADGPAALVVSEQQRAQISGLSVQISQTGRTVAAVQTGEDALNSIASLLAQARSLALDSANGGVNDQGALQANAAEVSNALASVQRIASTTQFGGQNLLDGSASDGLGAAITGDSPDAPGVGIPSVTVSALGLDKLSFTVPGVSAAGEPTQQTVEMSLAEALQYQSSPDGPPLDQETVRNAAVSAIDRAISTVNGARANLGAYQSNVLETTANNLRTSLESATSTEALVRDADYSYAVSSYTKAQVIAQAGQAAPGSENQTSALVASLLRG